MAKMIRRPFLTERVVSSNLIIFVMYCFIAQSYFFSFQSYMNCKSDCFGYWTLVTRSVFFFSFRQETALKKFEKKHGITKRWATSSAQYQYQHKAHLLSKTDDTVDAMYSRAAERLMLLALKKRYAGKYETYCSTMTFAISLQGI